MLCGTVWRAVRGDYVISAAVVITVKILIDVHPPHLGVEKPSAKRAGSYMQRVPVFLVKRPGGTYVPPVECCTTPRQNISVNSLLLLVSILEKTYIY